MKVTVGTAVLGLMLFGISASGSVVGVSGDLDFVPPPPSVVVQQFESNRIQVFLEQGHLTLGVDLSVDATGPGTYAFPGDLDPAVISAGAPVKSYLLSFDRETTDHGFANGTITFGESILGLMLVDGTLASSDTVCGAAGTTYPTDHFERGLELNGQDWARISSSGYSLTFDGEVQGKHDHVRIITAVPEPSMMGLGLCFGAFGVLRRRCRRR